MHEDMEGNLLCERKRSKEEKRKRVCQKEKEESGHFGPLRE
jgi:hypothetical protein